MSDNDQSLKGSDGLTSQEQFKDSSENGGLTKAPEVSEEEWEFARATVLGHGNPWNYLNNMPSK